VGDESGTNSLFKGLFNLGLILGHFIAQVSGSHVSDIVVKILALFKDLHNLLGVHTVRWLVEKVW
jgi:hypothetical protein